MSLIADIRAYMARAAGPVTPAEVADTLGEDVKKVRGAMYQAANTGAGMERDDDGTYSLIPGWMPRSGEEASDEAPGPATDSASQTTAAPPPAAPRTREPKDRGCAPRVAAPAASATKVDEDLVTVPRGVLRLLVVEMLESERPITADGRRALLALIRPAA